MIKIGYALLAGILILFSSPLLSSAAEMFRWVDEKGVVHFTDNIHNIPSQHRASATKITTSVTAPTSPSPYPTASDKVSVPIQRKGQVVLVQATINEKASGHFIVDTGASYSMISRAMASELDIDLEKKLPTIPFQTANGIIQAPLITLESIDVSGFKLQDLTAAVHDVFEDRSVAGLLGLNFLSRFRMDIDTEKGFLHLEKK